MLLCSILVVTIVFGQGNRPDLQGIVIDAQGQPVEAAWVQLRTPNGGCVWDESRHLSASTRTGADGRFRLPQPAGEMEIYVSHPNHAPAWVGAEPNAVIVLPEPSYLEFVLDTQAEVTVSSGQWHFARMLGSGLLRSGPLPPDLVLQWSVNAPDLRLQNGTVSLKTGQSRRIAVASDPGLSIRGQLIPPREGVDVWCQQVGAPQRVATTDAEGAFELRGLEEGPARLVGVIPRRAALVVDAIAGDVVELRWDG